MPGWLQQLLQNGKFWIFAIAIGVSVIGKILKVLEKQAKERQAKMDRQKRELESLRTGRPQEAGAPTQIATSQQQPFVPSAAAKQPEPSQASAREQLEALAAKRRAAIDELQRRRAGQSAAQTTPRSPEPMPTTPEQVLATMLGVPVLTRRGTSPSKPRTPARTNLPVNRPKPTAPQRSSAQSPSDRGRGGASMHEAPVPMKRASVTQTPLSPPHRVEAHRAEAAATVTPTLAVNPPDAIPSGITPRSDPLGLRSLTRGDLKRAIVLREIMDLPVGLRG